MAKKGTRFTAAEDKFIRCNYLLYPIKRIAKMLGRSEYGTAKRLPKLGISVPKELAEQRKKDSQIKKGTPSFNKGKKLEDYCSQEAIERMKKTQFKTGNVPHNTAEKDGDIRIRKDSNGVRFYKHIRISLGNWQLYHRYVWEKAYGTIPKEHIVRFRDGDSMNCELDNLELVPWTKNMEMNSIQRFPTELKEVIRLKSKINKKLKLKTTWKTQSYTLETSYSNNLKD